MVTAMATAVLLVGGLGVANAAPVHVTQKLSATSSAPHARGTAKLTLRGSTKGTFSVVGRRLSGGATYDVVVGGIKVGSLTTNAHGAGKVAFGAPKRGNRALLGFDPRGQSLAVRDSGGHDALDCDMPDDSNTAGEVACCVPDDDGVECEHRTPQDCTDEGGTVSSATGCFPDPCATAGGPTVTCCTIESTCGAFVDDDPEVGCHTGVTADHCAAQHGTVVTATSCDPNPCAPVPPVNLVTCCVPDDGEVECEFRTADLCAARGGTVSSATTCDPNPCATAPAMTAADENGDDQGENEQCGHHHHDDGDGNSQGGDGQGGGGDQGGDDQGGDH
jgi:hypothetical protein